MPKGRVGADGQPGIGAGQGEVSLTVPPAMAARKAPTIPGQSHDPVAHTALAGRGLGQVPGYWEHGHDPNPFRAVGYRVKT